MIHRAVVSAAILAGTRVQAQTDPPDCWSYSEEDCLGRSGCRWFSYDASEGCPLCEQWFGADAKDVAGCRSWKASDWCHRIIYQDALAKYGGRPDDDEFQVAISRYQVAQGNGEPGNPHQKRATCSVWCDLSSPDDCTAQPKARDEVKGVNYGGRLIPEYYLQLPGSADFFGDIRPPSNLPKSRLSLCDVAKAEDVRQRVAKFLDLNIREEHFQQMAARGFNVVRMPLGYWHLTGLPGNSTPNSLDGERWRALQYIMPTSSYMKWIDAIFVSAGKFGLKVLMDLHGGPGGQADRAFTGCDQGTGMFFFDTPWNRQIAVQAVEQMAKVCHKYGETCFGIELLNEPIGNLGPGHSQQHLSRSSLRDFYLDAIRAARDHLDKDKPIVIMDWPGWLPWWQERQPFDYANHGRIVFSTHLYREDNTDQEESRSALLPDLKILSDFYWQSKYDLFVSEYALSGHGSGGAEDGFDYSSLANWMVFQFSTAGLGSLVWNFDAAEWLPSWGSVAAPRVGQSPVDWKRAFAGAPSSEDLQATLV